MQTIDVDFEVFKELTVRRATESVSYNDVIRELLGLEKSQPSVTNEQAIPGDWIAKGVRFPGGTEFRVTYKGKQYTASVDGGLLAYNGKKYDSPSSAAMAITGSPVNGWRFWECRLPNKATWQIISSLRK